MAGLREGIPFGELCSMQLNVLVMMLESQFTSRKKSGAGSTDGVRNATQADIETFFG